MIERIGSVAGAAALELSTTRLVDVILEQVQLLGASSAAVFLWDADSEELKLAGQRGLPENLVGRFERVPLDAPLLAAESARTRKLRIVRGPDRLEHSSSLADQLLEPRGDITVISVPLTVADRLVGVMTFAVGGAERLSDEQLAAVRATACVFAASLEAARIHEHDRAQLEALRVAALAIASSHDLASVLHAIVDHAHVLADARACAVGLLADHEAAASFDAWIVGGAAAPDAGLLGSKPPVAGLLAAVASEGRTVRLRPNEPIELATGAHVVVPVSFLGVPIAVRGKTIGGLFAADRCRGDAFTDEQEHLLEVLARHASAAIEGARQWAKLVDEIARRNVQERALHESNERFQRFAARAPDIIARWRLMPSWALEFVSPAVEGVLGYRPEDYYRNPGLWQSQIHPFDRVTMELAIQLPERMTKPVTLRWVHKSGRIVWTESRLTPVRDDQGNIIAVEAISRDVTERKQAEAEMERLLNQARQARRWLETVIEASPTGIVLVEDPIGRRITANREAERIFGRQLDPNAGIQQYAARILRPSGEPVAPVELLTLRALRGETVTGEERICRREDGQEIPVLVSAAPVTDAQGNITGAVVVYRDASDIKELARMREEWISIIAHDLRQPVTVIGAQASALTREVTDPKALTKIEHIRVATDRLSRMISDLLDVSCVDAGRLTLEKRPLDVAEQVHRVVDGVAPTMRDRPIRISVEGEIPPIRADAHRLEQILDNLLSNAAKYGYPGTPIDVAIQARDAEVLVSVTNEGAGVAADEVQHVFDRFRRSGVTPERTAGLGLGLYIARSLVELHGGRIWAETQPGRSTTFSFTMPAIAVEHRVSA